MQGAKLAVEFEPVRAHRLKMRTAGDKRDVIAGRRQPGPEVAADAAGTHHHEFHRNRIGSFMG
jgi:hypothetical protein